MFKKILCILISLSVCVVFFGCEKEEKADFAKIKIIATLFPQYDFAREITKGRADVSLIIPPGADTHSYEPTPRQIMEIENADMFIYTGKIMEPWAEKLIKGSNNKNLTVVDLSKGIKLLRHNEDEEEHNEHHKEHGDYDPHIWTSPVNAMTMCSKIFESACRIDEKNRTYYKKNYNDYINELKEIDNEIRSVVESSKRKDIIFGGKFALLYFVNEYGLEYTSAFDSCVEHAEPSVKIMNKLIKKIISEEIPVVFYEELSEPRVAKTISYETGAKPLLFHSCHNISKRDFENNEGYVSLMKNNIVNLKEALN